MSTDNVSKNKLHLDPVNTLRADHERVKLLFGQFFEVENRAERRRIGRNLLFDLSVHSKLEEGLFYPAVEKEFQAPRIGVPSTRNAELHPKRVAVRLCRACRDPERPSHLVVRAAGCDEGDHLPLPIRDRRTSLNHRIDHASTLRGRGREHHSPVGVFIGVSTGVKG